MLNDIRHILLSEVTMKATVDIILCFVVFLIVYFLCRIGRLKNDIVENAVEDTEKMLKIHKNLASLLGRKTVERNSIRKALKKLKRCAKNTKSILQVKLYDGGDDPDLTAAIKLLDAVLENIVQFTLHYNMGDSTGVDSILDTIKDKLEKTHEILSAVKKRNDEYCLSKL